MSVQEGSATRQPPRRRLRTRLALLHAALAFACGLVLLAVADVPLFTGGQTAHKPDAGQPRGPVNGVQTTGNLPEVLRYSAVALVVIAGASVVLGWLIAGRALRPLHVITSSARTMSAENLNDRLRVPAAYREFAELADTLDGLVRRLRESFTAQRQFVANASHELRTPLTAQRTLLQVTLADPDATADTLRATCREVLTLGRQQEHLINALLNLASGYREIDRWERLDLADITRKVLLDHHAETQHHHLRVHATLDSTTVSGDPDLLTSLVANLVDNAIRHNIPGGTIEIATTAPGRLTIGNTGTTIPSGEINRLFQPFQRLRADRTDQTGGHGLGLAIIAAIAHAHRAQLAAHPQPGGGLRVAVDFPPAQPPC